METKVLTQEEIAQIKQVQQDRLSLIEKYGIIEMQIRELELQKQTLSSDHLKLKQTEESLGTQLQTKYGNGTIDLEKGLVIIN